MRYLLYKPEDYAAGSEPWPLIVFLHGRGERGDDLSLVEREALPWLLKSLRSFPFLVVSPQCPSGHAWSVETLGELLVEVLQLYRVDTGRVSVMGLSDGATAALNLAASDPGRFAAAVAIAPQGGPADPCRLRTVPVWIFHNSGDKRIPVGRSRKLARALEACGGEVQLTVYPQEGHDAWTDTFGREDLYAWLLKQHRSPA